MNTIKIALVVILLCLTEFNYQSFAQEKDSLQNIETFKTWDRFSVKLGGFVASVNTGIRIGSKQSGVGLDINLETILGMDVRNFVFRTDAMYRFGKTKRHSIIANYFSFTRTANKVLETEIKIGDYVYPVDTEIDSRFDLSIVNISYDYSFFSDERINLGASFGFFIMPIKFDLSTSGAESETTDFVAPLPVVGLRTDFAITPKLFLKQGIQVLYLSFDGFTGSITDFNISLEHNTWKHFGFGLGLNMYKLKIEIRSNSYPQIDMIGNIEMGYTGLLFFAKYYF